MAKATRRIDVAELDKIDWSLRDIAKATLASSNPRVKSSGKTLVALADRIKTATGWGKKMPTIVCLCGSTRFSQQFQEASLQETLAGRIVLSIGCNMRTDDDIFGDMSDAEKAKIKEKLDKLHLRKIDLADQVFIVNVDGYIGESTSREIAYAKELGKLVRYLEDPNEKKETEEPKTEEADAA